MKLKVIVAALVVTAVPLCGQAQEPKMQKAPKATKAPPVSKVAGCAKVVKTISGAGKDTDLPDIGKLGEQIEQAEQKNDMKKIDELNKKMDELATKLGPEYVALMGELEDVDPSSKDGQDISSALAGLDKLCAK